MNESRQVLKKPVLHAAFQQLVYLYEDLRMMVNKKWWRWFTFWFGGSAGVNVSYRLDRCFYLLLGNSWRVVRPLFFPLFLFLKLISSNHAISYRAEIGKGLAIQHPQLGIVVSGAARIGDYLTLTGGNLIGRRHHGAQDFVIIGDHVSLGANAVILGPVCIGNKVTIGAGAVVTKDAPDGVTLVGVPAHILFKADEVVGSASGCSPIKNRIE